MSWVNLRGKETLGAAITPYQAIAIGEVIKNPKGLSRMQLPPHRDKEVLSRDMWEWE